MTTNFSDEQSNKAQSGQHFKSEIEYELNRLIESGVLKSFEKQVNFNHQGYSYNKQYLANYIIKTHKDQYFVVNGSNTMRSDRIKSTYYDFLGIMSNWEFAHLVIGYICVFGNEQLNVREFERERGRFRTGTAYTPATHFFVLSEFKDFLEEYNSTEQITLEEIIEAEKESDIARGSRFSKSGIEFEQNLVETLKNAENLLLYTSNSMAKTEPYSIILDKILDDKKRRSNEIVKVDATNKIPQLLSGGNPKTDIRIDLYFKGNEQISETISIKKSQEKQVSCHDYTSDAFSRVLNCQGEKLDEYFNLFQINPSYERFESALKLKGENYTIADFKSLLSEKSNIFNEWVLTGRHDDQNILYPNDQISNYLLIVTPTSTIFHSMTEYLEMLNRDLMKSKKYHFGVPFNWTRPSKQEGKRIQLKLPILNH